ncbi:MAG: hypothetical protein HLUCCO16_20600 [Phormidium sp. OSCR]|nr:MAG: hypothetical protein HLUCCO16_20600 [Phormidium sp. OSCR]
MSWLRAGGLWREDPGRSWLGSLHESIIAAEITAKHTPRGPGPKYRLDLCLSAGVEVLAALLIGDRSIFLVTPL